MGDVTFQQILDRVNAIQDPELKAKARATLLRLVEKGGAQGGPGDTVDLAIRLPVRNKGGKTNDGRKSFARQGKWAHGFVPLDDAAKEAKAKGSPIARKRIERLFNKARSKDVKQTEAVQVKGREGVKEERVQRVAQSRNAEIPQETTRSQRVKDPEMEKMRGGQIRRRSDKPWAEIPDEQKVTRNGKRYVLTTFQGKQQLTEWFGPNYNFVETTNLTKRKLSNISSAQAGKMSTSQLRALLRVPGQPAHVKKVLRATMEAKYTKNRTRG